MRRTRWDFSRCVAFRLASTPASPRGQPNVLALGVEVGAVNGAVVGAGTWPWHQPLRAPTTAPMRRPLRPAACVRVPTQSASVDREAGGQRSRFSPRHAPRPAGTTSLSDVGSPLGDAPRDPLDADDAGVHPRGVSPDRVPISGIYFHAPDRVCYRFALPVSSRRPVPHLCPEHGAQCGLRADWCAQ